MGIRLLDTDRLPNLNGNDEVTVELANRILNFPGLPGVAMPVSIRKRILQMEAANAGSAPPSK